MKTNVRIFYKNMINGFAYHSSNFLVPVIFGDSPKQIIICSCVIVHTAFLCMSNIPYSKHSQCYIFQKANGGEALEFLRMSFDSCKLESSALILLYDELGALVKRAKLQPAIMEWYIIIKFETYFIVEVYQNPCWRLTFLASSYYHQSDECCACYL